MNTLKRQRLWKYLISLFPDSVAKTTSYKSLTSQRVILEWEQPSHTDPNFTLNEFIKTVNKIKPQPHGLICLQLSMHGIRFHVLLLHPGAHRLSKRNILPGVSKLKKLEENITEDLLKDLSWLWNTEECLHTWKVLQGTGEHLLASTDKNGPPSLSIPPCLERLYHSLNVAYKKVLLG